MKLSRTQQKKRSRAGLSFEQRRAIADQLRKTTCSAAWIDAMLPAIETKAGHQFIFDASVYPPPADTSPMVVCESCGVPTPGYYIGSRGICLDCYCVKRPKIQNSFGRSTWAATMKAVRRGNLRLSISRLVSAAPSLRVADIGVDDCVLRLRDVK